MLLAVTFYFLDFAGIIPPSFPNLARIQFAPALLTGSVVILVLLLLLTVLFGRVYCSVICPMGLFQDVIARIARRIHAKKRYSFRKERRVLRYSVLALVFVPM